MAIEVEENKKVIYTKEEKEKVFMSAMGIAGYEGLYSRFEDDNMRHSKAFKDLLKKYGNAVRRYMSDLAEGRRPKIFIVNDNRDNIDLFLMMFLTVTSYCGGLKYSPKDLIDDNYHVDKPDEGSINTSFAKFPRLAILDIQDSLNIMSERSEEYVWGLLKEQLVYRFDNNLPTLVVGSNSDFKHKLDTARFEFITSLKSVKDIVKVQSISNAPDTYM